jgi:NAD(P)H-hydrate epimerase
MPKGRLEPTMSIPYPPGEALTCQQMRDLDVLTIEHVGISGLVLMENAGRGAAEYCYGVLVNPREERVVILCGPGNNGGDGFVVARWLHNAGVPVEVVLAASPEKSTGDAGANLRILERMGLELVRAYEPAGLALCEARLGDAHVVVDALLGTGSRGAPRGTLATLIALANAAPRARRIALDIPSGLDGDQGRAWDPCFRADLTLTMVAPKAGFQHPAARACVGRVVAVEIGTPRGLIPGRPVLNGA